MIVSICVLECVFVIHVLFITIYMSVYVKRPEQLGYNFFQNAKNILTGASSRGI